MPGTRPTPRPSTRTHAYPLGTQSKALALTALSAKRRIAGASSGGPCSNQAHSRASLASRSASSHTDPEPKARPYMPRRTITGCRPPVAGRYTSASRWVPSRNGTSTSVIFSMPARTRRWRLRAAASMSGVNSSVAIRPPFPPASREPSGSPVEGFLTRHVGAPDVLAILPSWVGPGRRRH